MAGARGDGQPQVEGVQGVKVYFVSDVEGDYEYWRTCVGACKGLVLPEWLPHVSADASGVHLAPDSHFVFGGDVCDKGPGSIRVVHELLSLHDRYPDRVHILLGNRDINKLRLTSELASSELLHNKIDFIPGAYWLKESDRVAPKDFLEKMVANHLFLSGAAQDQKSDRVRDADTRMNRLKYILDCTMGAVGDFENRREELRRLELASHEAASVSDEQVVASYMSSLEEGGFMRQLLFRGKLACIIGDTLFVHGGVSGSFRKPGSSIGGGTEQQSALGYIPGAVLKRYSASQAAEWVRDLNAWKDEQMRAWSDSPMWSGPPNRDAGLRTRGGNDLMDYVVPGTLPSVVLARHIDREGNPEPLEPDSALWLKGAGLRRVVCGHTPVGCCPHLSREAHGIELVCADTSYSNNKRGDRRGEAWGLVTIWPFGDSSLGVRMEGVTHEGKPYKSEVGAPEKTPLDACVGRRTRDGRFVKQRMEDGTYLLYRVEGRRTYLYTYETEATVLSIMLA